MSKTSIEWTRGDDGTPGRTWNPVTGCTKVSPGCKNCYAEGVADRFWGSRKFTEVMTHPDRLGQPLRWKKPQRIFVNSMSDLFHEAVPGEFIAEVWRVMSRTPRHTYQILTKRADRLPQIVERLVATFGLLPNVWIGVSIENQEAADERIPLLLETAAAVRFLSVEPLLGSVDLTHLDADRAGHLKFCQVDALTGRHTDMGRPCSNTPSVDWVIVGGESGPYSRPCNVDWVRSVVAQCKAAGVPCFVKQLGANIRWDGCQRGDQSWPVPTPITDRGGEWQAELRDRKGGDPQEWPSDLRVREFPEVRS